MQYRVLVIGSTGLVGKELVNTLLSRPNCVSVTQITRQKPALTKPNQKLRTITLSSFDNLSPRLLDKLPQHKIDVAFCMLGTRHPTNMSMNAQRKVDVLMVSQFADICKDKGVRYFGYNSFVYATPHSSHPLTKLKGESENNLREKRFERLSIYKPAWITTPEPDVSGVKSLYQRFMIKFDHYARSRFRVGALLYCPTFLLPVNYRNTDPEVLAKAAIADAEAFLGGHDDHRLKRVGWKGLKRLFNNDMRNLASTFK